MIWRREDAEPEHAEAPRVPAPPERKDKDMAENGEVTIVGTGARLEGNVVSAGNLRIDGHQVQVRHTELTRALTVRIHA